MNFIEIENVRFLQFDHISTLNLVSLKPFDMSSDNGKLNRHWVARKFNFFGERIVFSEQMHSGNIQIVDRFTMHQKIANTDALITTEPNLAIGVVTADCVPVLLHDPEKHVVAAIHAGWRGTVQYIVSNTINKMKIEFGSEPAKIQAGIGPSIAPDVYEVGEEVYETFIERGHNRELFERSVNGKYLLNLWKANQLQMINAGVLSNHIEIAGLCTYKKKDLLYSARREGINTGRLAAVISNVVS